MAMKWGTTLVRSMYGLGTAIAFSVSPLFVKRGMADGHPAIVGLAVGLVAALVVYSSIVFFTDREAVYRVRHAGLRLAAWEGSAALVIVAGTWMRYVSMALIPLAIVSAVGRVNIIVILLLAWKSVRTRVWLGGLLIIAGTVLLSI